MILDEVRMGAYLGALEAAIEPGDVVMDIGTGAGTMAMLAARMGASHVYALDPNPSVRLAQLAVERNGLADKVTVIEGVSTEFDPSEPIDVIVSDLRDRLPTNGLHIPSVIDARDRLLKPGGVQIPLRDIMYAAPINHQRAYDKHVAAWQADLYDLDMSMVTERTVNSHEMCRASPEHLIAAAQSWATIDYSTVTDPTVRGEVSWTMAREGVAHGLEVWFDAEIGSGFTFSNSPDAPDLVYGTEFFPFTEPLDLLVGDVLHCALDANFVVAAYIWRWRTTLTREGETLKSFDQSDLKGSFDDPRPILLRQRPTHVPVLSPEARATHLVLDAFVHAASVAEAIAALNVAGIDGFETLERASALVTGLSARYSTAGIGQ
jgi:protein arginine N-methyltransferase 1